jgi:hypothetical protein
MNGLSNNTSNSIMINGIGIGAIEIILFFFISCSVRHVIKRLQNINIISYIWLSLTVLTGIWEASYIINNKNINNYSQYLITYNEHVWTNKYSITYILPNKLANIFYAEYGAFADREYMIETDDWSRIIEGTHAIFCGIFAATALFLKGKTYPTKYNLTVGISMGSQLMNSILYMGQYFIEISQQYSVNYNNTSFPVGDYLSKRPFMYVNIFWTIMPIYVLYDHYKTVSKKVNIDKIKS